MLITYLPIFVVPAVSNGIAAKLSDAVGSKKCEPIVAQPATRTGIETPRAKPIGTMIPVDDD